MLTNKIKRVLQNQQPSINTRRSRGVWNSSSENVLFQLVGYRFNLYFINLPWCFRFYSITIHTTVINVLFLKWLFAFKRFSEVINNKCINNSKGSSRIDRRDLLSLPQKLSITFCRNETSVSIPHWNAIYLYTTRISDQSPCIRRHVILKFKIYSRALTYTFVFPYSGPPSPHYNPIKFWNWKNIYGVHGGTRDRANGRFHGPFRNVW